MSMKIFKAITKKRALHFVLIAVLAFTSIPFLQTNTVEARTCTTQELAQREQYNSDQDVAHYTPCEPVCGAGSSTGGTPLMGDSNEEKIFRWLTSNGFNDAQAAGVLGNIWKESGFNPFRMQTTYSSQGIEAVLPTSAHSGYNKAFGLVQWDGGRRQRVLDAIAPQFPEYVNWINSYGKSGEGYKDAPNEVNDGFLTFQLSHVKQELEEGYTAVYESIIAEPDTEEGVRNVTEIWNRRYEVSADRGTTRHDQAVMYYNQFKGGATGGSSSSDGAAAGEVDCSEGGGGQPAGEVVWYGQCDDRWGSDRYGTGIYEGYGGTRPRDMCSSGCGPTSMAIILASLVDSTILPSDVAAVAGAQGKGTSSHSNLINGVREKWGVTITAEFGLEGAINFLKEGKGYVWSGGSGVEPYTGGGHMVALVGVSDDGQTITVADPIAGYSPTHKDIGEYSKSIIASGGDYFYGVSK